MSYIQDPTAFLGPPPLTAGQYYFPLGQSSVTTTTTGTGALRLLPWLVQKRTTIDRIGAEVTTIGDVGSKYRLGIYADNGSGLPRTLVLDAGTINGDSATVQELTCNVVLTPGVYWIGGAAQVVTTTQPTMRTITLAHDSPIPLPQGATLPAAATAVFGMQLGSVTGALPTTFTGQATSGNGARLLVRVA